MSKEIMDIHEVLKLQLCNIYWTYGDNEVMRDHEKEMDNSGPIFFNRIHFALIRDMCLSLCRLLDPETTRNYKNLSIFSLLSKIKEVNEEDHKNLLTKINLKIQKLSTITDSVRIIRNKVIGHNDYDTLIGRTYLTIKYEDLYDSMGFIAEILNEVEFKYNNSTTVYDCPDSMHAKHVLYLIKKGIEAREAKLQHQLGNTEAVEKFLSQF